MSHGPSATGGAAITTTPHGHSSEPYTPVFVGETKAKLDALLKRYPTKMAALLPALWMVQEARGWVSPEAMAEVGQVLGLTAAYVKGVVTFYTMYHQHPVGKHFIQVCTTTPCHVCGAEDVVITPEIARGLADSLPDARFRLIENAAHTPSVEQPEAVTVAITEFLKENVYAE